METKEKKNSVLDRLVSNGTIDSYRYVDVDQDGNELQTGESRNTEKLEITFTNGKTLIIDTFCSGCAENTVMTFSTTV